MILAGMIAAPQAAFAETPADPEPGDAAVQPMAPAEAADPADPGDPADPEDPTDTEDPVEPLPAPKPVISGKAGIGGKLSVKKATRWQHETVKYRWYVGTKSANMKLVGTSATLKIKNAWLGKKARVQVTGVEPGRPDVVKKSASVAIGVQKRKGQAAPKYSKGWYNFKLTWQGQETGVWCGPASAVMVLKKLGYTRSADGEKLTQARLASSKYFKTVRHQRTWPRYMHSGLKKWIGETKYRRVNGPSYREVTKRISDSFTKTGRPVIVHITGKPSRPSVNHHGRYHYTHVMVVERWNPKTKEVVLVDPGAKGHAWAKAKPRVKMKIKKLSGYLKEFGVYA